MNKALFCSVAVHPKCGENDVDLHLKVFDRFGFLAFLDFPLFFNTSFVSNGDRIFFLTAAFLVCGGSGVGGSSGDAGGRKTIGGSVGCPKRKFRIVGMILLKSISTP